MPETPTTPPSDGKIITPEFRLSFPSLFEPKPGKKPGDKPKYELNMLFPKTTDISALKHAAKAAAIETWGVAVELYLNRNKGATDAEKAANREAFIAAVKAKKVPADIHFPFRDGDEKTYDGYAGHTYVRAWSYQRPGVVDHNVVKIVDPEQVYPGCWCIASIRFYTFENDGKSGVSVALMNVQKIRDGETFSSHSKPEDDFAKVAAAVGTSKSEEPDF